jgi:transcriptional antiterminator RfaH
MYYYLHMSKYEQYLKRDINMSKEWFILQFKPNAHHQANKNLNQQGFETFLPLHDITSRNVSRFINSTRPLFPGYMFITFDRTETTWHKINNTYGVLRLVTFNSILNSIPITFVNNLMKRCDLSGKLLPMQKLKKGDQVKLLKGPFVNFAATVETYENDQRIWVLMDLMGRSSKIQTNSDNLQPLN